MDGSQATKWFILDAGGALLPCEDPQAHAEWMADPSNTVIMRGKVSGCSHHVRTVFTGENVGTEELPIYFETWIDPVSPRVNVVRDHDPQGFLYARSPDWTQAVVWHGKAIAHARRMIP